MSQGPANNPPAGMDAAVQAAPMAGAAPTAGAMPPSAAGSTAAGSSASSAGAQAPAAHVCAIPNEIVVQAMDADGGVDADCKNVPLKVIGNNCIGGFCHDSNGPPAGHLDLMAPCVAERLVNVKSDCEDMLLLDVAHPEQSFLIDKLNSQRPVCGKTMPDGGHLPPAELACMNAWITAVLRAAKAL